MTKHPAAAHDATFAGAPIAPGAFDAVIVGAGLSGSLTAAVLGRQGCRVALLDRHQDYPPEFRVEKISGIQVAMLERLGLLDCVAAASTRFDEVVNARHGRIIDTTRAPHYGILYHDLVKVVRSQFPASVDFVVGQAIDIKTSDDSQQVLLSDGRTIESRIVILATGMHDGLRHKLGINRRTVFEKHSVSFGFTIAPGPNQTFEFPALTYYGEQTADRIDYLSIFPIGSTMRANLFTFRDHRDSWIRDLRRQPEATLLQTMPGLQQFLGEFQVVDKVQNWTMDLYLVENHLRSGVVIVGDSFQTSCPAAGTGVARLLTDVDQLCNEHLPRWLATPGMSAEKIAQFYTDPVKQKSDGHSAHLANYRRSLTIDQSWRWEARRCQALVRRRVLGWIRGLRPVRATSHAKT